MEKLNFQHPLLQSSCMILQKSLYADMPNVIISYAAYYFSGKRDTYFLRILWIDQKYRIYFK